MKNQKLYYKKKIYDMKIYINDIKKLIKINHLKIYKN